MKSRNCMHLLALVALGGLSVTLTGCPGASQAGQNQAPPSVAPPSPTDAAPTEPGAAAEPGSGPAAPPADGAPPAGTRTEGSVAGHTLSAKQVIFAARDDRLTIVISSSATACAELLAGQRHAGSTRLELQLPAARALPSDVAAQPQSLTLGSDTGAEARFVALDASCRAAASPTPSGSVTLARTDVSLPDAFAGTFALRVGSEALAGSFVATYCQALAEQIGTPEPTAACVP